MRVSSYKATLLPKCVFLFVLSFLLFGCGVADAATVIRVNISSAGGDGSNWADALSEDQFPAALEAAGTGASGDVEFWVAKGVYRPTLDTGDLNASFVLSADVKLYGGFAGTEMTRDERDWKKNVTVLTGDLAGDDLAEPYGVVSTDAGIVGSNSNNVATVPNGASGTLDGFTVTAAGNNGMLVESNGSAAEANCTFAGNRASNGGGMYVWIGASATVTDCAFSYNSADGYGGGMYVYKGSATVANCTFSGNKASNGGGGGMWVEESSTATVTNCTFSGNTVGGFGVTGGGIFFKKCSATVTNCTFSGNKATRNGGGMFVDSLSSATVANCTFSYNAAETGGGMYVLGDATLTNCTFAANSAGNYGGGMVGGSATNCTFSGNTAGMDGGGMYVLGDATLTNCTFAANSAGNDGGGMFVDSLSSATVTNCILWGNGSEIYHTGGSVRVTHSVISADNLASFDASCTSADPLLDVLADNGGPTQTIALRSGSPAIDAGTLEGLSDEVKALISVDQRGVVRPQGASFDIGAYELRPSPAPPGPDPTPTLVTVTATAGPGGSVRPTSESVPKNGSATFTFTADEGYAIESLTDGGTPVPGAAGTTRYTHTAVNVTAPRTLAATFRPKPAPPVSPDVPVPVTPPVSIDVDVAPYVPIASTEEAARLLAGSGLTEASLEKLPSGEVVLKDEAIEKVAKTLLPKENIPKMTSLPVRLASPDARTDIAYLKFELKGSALWAGKASEVRLLKVLAPEKGQLLRHMEVASLSQLEDGRFTVLDDKAVNVTDIKNGTSYFLYVAIKDDGPYDLDRTDGNVADPLAILSVKAKGTERSSGGGCDAGFSLMAWAALLAVGAVWRRR